MNELLDKCRIGYRFGKITPDKKYWLCCGGVSSIGSWDEDGSFKKFWNSERYQNLRDVLQNDIKNFDEVEVCNFCPHYVTELDWNKYYKHINTDGKPKQGPREFQFEVGNPCNHRCDFCWHWSKSLLEIGHPNPDWKEWSKQFIEWDVFKSIIDDLEELGGCELISISGGGEPFVLKDMMKMLSYVKSKKFELKLFTNFSIISQKDIERLVEMEIDELDINISAGTKETYSDLRGVKPKEWDKLLERLRYLGQLKTDKTFVKYVNILTKDNIEEVEEIFSISSDVKIDMIDFRVMTSHPLYEKLIPTESQIKKFVKCVPRLSSKYKVNYWNELDYVRS